MPEMRFVVRWPDESATECYSPSLVIKDYFTPGASYSLAEFLSRSRTALGIASERVRIKYGSPCSRALDQLAEIERIAGSHADRPGAAVTVETFRE
jgi:uncharacterized repeat protein (TIGR04042 family)